MRTHNIPSYYRKIKLILIMSPDLALFSTLNGSNYPCLELTLMVPKVFEPLKFYCLYMQVKAIPWLVRLNKEIIHELQRVEARGLSPVQADKPWYN